MKPLFLFFFISIAIDCCSQDSTGLKLWYKQPSGGVWENALPVGNGFLGAMVYGNVDTETVQLNEGTVWSGSPNRNDNTLIKDSLSYIRSLIFNGKQKEAERIADRILVSRTSQGQMFEPVGNLRLGFDNHNKYTNYYRELDIEKAVQKTVYTVANVTYTREVIASFVDKAVVIHLTASRPHSLSFRALFQTPQPNAVIKTTSPDQLTISGTTIDHEQVQGKVRFKGIVRLKLNGGSLSLGDTSLSIKDADEVTIYISIATNFNNYQDISGDENKRAEDNLGKAYSKSFSEILKEHVAAYQKYFNRVKLDLGTTDAAKLPTNTRLKNFDSVNDPQFVTLYYQFGRYLLISSSQPGGQPATLQGIWNNQLFPPWDSKYTININAEMNYWPAEKTNLSELHEPLLAMVKELSVTGQQTARDMYGARGWMAHHNTDIWRSSGAVDGAFWGLWSNGGGWLSQHLWEHYLYNGDTAFLESAYPALKGAAEFYADYLVEHPKFHWLVVSPDESPENAPAAHGGSSLDAGVTMTNQIVFDVFSNAIRAAQVLQKDQAFADTLKQLRSRLPPMHIGRHGQLQEWLDDVDDSTDHHRHISHLYGLFPSNQISPYRTPELSSAARETLLERGDISTGWSMGWKINWWAKMLDGNHAYRLIQNQLTPVGTNAGGGGTYNNLFDAHPPFQIDGNLGCTSGITEMLMQSEDGVLALLPALPDAWPTGVIEGLRARGGFGIVNMKWEKGKLTRVMIYSGLGGNLRLRVPNEMTMEDGKYLPRSTGENSNIFYKVDSIPTPIISPIANIKQTALKQTFTYDIATVKNNTYTFIAKSRN